MSVLTWIHESYPCFCPHKLFVGTNISFHLKWKGTACIYKMSVCGTEKQEVMGGLEKLCDEELQKCVGRVDSAGLV